MSATQTLESAQRFPSASRAAEALASRVADIIGFAVRARGRASLLVPGGRTPIPLFEALRSLELPWASVYVSLTDERRVPQTDPNSNARLVQEVLLKDKAADAHFQPLHRDGVDDRADEAACGAALGMLPRPFDAVILGMGDDAHFASLFPGDAASTRALSQDTEARCATTCAPSEPHARLSLTLATLLESRWIALHLSGAAKWDAIQNAAAADDARQYPVQALLAQRRVPVHVYWSP